MREREVCDHMRTLIILLAAAFVAVGMPLAAADESHPDCEDEVTWTDKDGNTHTGPQPWIGYRSTETVRAIYYNNAPGPLSTINACEGEHWDGQDTVQDDEPVSCPTPAVKPAADDLFINMCLGANPGDASTDDPLNPLGLRVSYNGSDAYVGLNIGLVGQVVLFANDESAAVYVRDNTVGNVLATIVSSAGITRGFVSENDCNQSTYQKGAMENDRSLCGRDNTAITVEHGLLP